MNRTKHNVTLAMVFYCLAGTEVPAQTLEKTDDGAVKADDGKQRDPLVMAGPKISRRLVEASASGEPMPVVVIYRQQPQREAAERVENAMALYHHVAEGDVQRSAVLGEKGARQASERLARVRREGRALIRRAVRQQLDGFQMLKAARLQGTGARNVRRYWMHNMITADIPAQTLAELEADPDVAAVFPDPVLRLAADFRNDAIDVNTGVLGVASWWNAGIRGAGQPVVVLDTGINVSHPVFAGKEIVARSFLGSVRNSRCFADDATSPEDRQGHGTHVAGIIAGAGESVLRAFQGTAPEVGQIISLKVGAALSGTGGCPTNSISGTDVIRAIQWALDNTSARIFNMSFGAEVSQDDPAFAQLIDEIADVHGLTIVAAAGNEGAGGASTVGDTGLSFNGISVANWDTRGTFSKSDDRVHPSSSLGPSIGGRFKPDLAAPGTSIVSASNVSDRLVRMTGTSMAAPKVAGVAAMLHQAGITDPAAVKALLINTTDQVGWKADRGWGLINLERAQSPNTLLRGEVAPGGYALFRGRNAGQFYATLTWNRHGTLNRGFAFHDLDLVVYDAEGIPLSASESGRQNVEQVAVRTEGDVLVKVKAFNETFAGGITRERFALAVSAADFTPALGAVPSARCTADANTVSRGASFVLTCVLTNQGDTAGTGTQISLNLSGAAPENAGTLGVGQQLERRYRITAPGTPGTYTIQFTGSTTTAGETVTAQSAFVLTVR
ncbi:MAG: S8 family serine peptidase [Bryobacterales bacterium]|nr:S8 family serine peptidase [Bryobacterales bacterium]